MGVTHEQLKDKNTANFIYDFVEKHGGIQEANRQLEEASHNAGPPPPPNRNRNNQAPSRGQGGRGLPPPPPRDRGAPPPPPSSRSGPPPPAPSKGGAPPPPPPPPPIGEGTMLCGVVLCDCGNLQVVLLLHLHLLCLLVVGGVAHHHHPPGITSLLTPCLQFLMNGEIC